MKVPYGSFDEDAPYCGGVFSVGPSISLLQGQVYGELEASSPQVSQLDLFLISVGIYLNLLYDRIKYAAFVPELSLT